MPLWQIALLFIAGAVSLHIWRRLRAKERL